MLNVTIVLTIGTFLIPNLALKMEDKSLQENIAILALTNRTLVRPIDISNTTSTISIQQLYNKFIEV